jgi:iron uptake system component EfeO
MRRIAARLTAAALPLLLLSGCVANGAGGTSVAVAITDDSCAVATADAKAGTVTFRLTNGGTDENEFYVLGNDKASVVAEKEHLTPGQTATLAVNLDAGSYYTACKFRQTGNLVGVAGFTVAD